MGNTLSFKKEFGLILVGAIVFTASFLWKDFLSDVQEKYFPRDAGLLGRAFYTIAITILLIVIAVNLRSYFGLSNQKKPPVEFDDSPIQDDVDMHDVVDMHEMSDSDF